MRRQPQDKYAMRILMIILLSFLIGAHQTCNSQTLNFPSDGFWYSWTPSTSPYTLLDDGGTSDYNNNALGGLTIYPTNGVIRITFNQFDVESQAACNYDYLSVYQGEDFSNLIGKYCGSTLPPQITSTHVSGALTLVWSTDISITQGGFDITVEDYSFSLPITLVSFTAEPTEAIQPIVNINFQVASQVNNDYFEVQRSQDAINWETISQIEGHGTTNTQLSYNALDDNPMDGISYYRLSQTDYDGQTEEFQPVSVVISSKEPKLLRVVNIHGQTTDPNSKGLLLYIYEDQTVKKVVNATF